MNNAGTVSDFLWLCEAKIFKNKFSFKVPTKYASKHQIILLGKIRVTAYEVRILHNL